MTFVKICGNRTPADVLAAAEAGADFVGMIFADSKRRVDVETATADAATSAVKKTYMTKAPSVGK